jgi:uncharacterized membrane protein
MIIGMALMFLAVLLAIFNIQSYSQLSETDKAGEQWQFGISIGTLVVAGLYFIYTLYAIFRLYSSKELSPNQESMKSVLDTTGSKIRSTTANILAGKA